MICSENNSIFCLPFLQSKYSGLLLIIVKARLTLLCIDVLKESEDILKFFGASNLLSICTITWLTLILLPLVVRHSFAFHFFFSPDSLSKRE